MQQRLQTRTRAVPHTRKRLAAYSSAPQVLMSRAALLEAQERTPLALAIDQYMYCHPDTVVLRRGLPKLLRWQHLIGAEGSVLRIKFEAANARGIESIQLHCRHLVLEQVGPITRMIQRHCLSVAWLDDWIAFRWTTRRGNTQFQVKLSASRDARVLVRLLHETGCRIDQLRSDLLSHRMRDTACFPTEESAETHSLTRNLSQTSYQHLMDDSQLEPLTTYTYASQTPNRASQKLSQDSWQLSHSRCCPSLSQTEFCAAEETQHSTLSLLPPAPRLGPRSMSAKSISLSTRSRLDSVFGQGSHWHGSASGDSSMIGELDIAHLVRRKHNLHLAFESYAYTSPPQSQARLVKRTKWYHVGLASDLCLSLVPATGKLGQPSIVLTHASRVLAEFHPSSESLHAYYGGDILGLRQKQSGSWGAHVQIQMVTRYLFVVLQWLKFWNVSASNHAEPVLATESTHVNSMGPRPSSVESRKSGISYSSRMPRHSARRARALALAE